MKAMGAIPDGYDANGDGALTIGGIDARALVEDAGGTPLFVYDNNLVGAKIALFRAALPDGIGLHYAVKANPYPPLLKWICQFVDGFDIASEGELAALEQVGAACIPLSFAGPGKSDRELMRAVKAKATVSVESEGEAARLLEIAGKLGIRPRMMVRVNPPFQLKGAGMKMGGAASPFGIDHDRCADVVRGLVEAGADWRGLHIYPGSQCLDWAAIVEAQGLSVALAGQIADEAGHEPPEVNLGGGFGIPYFAGEEPLDLYSMGQALGAMLAECPVSLGASRFTIELGRWLVGEAGVYLTRVTDRKKSRSETFLVTDGGLQHMLAASGNFGQLLRRNYPVAVATRFGAPVEEVANVVGNLCTPLDILGQQVELPHADVGDLIAVFCAGAYGLSASPLAFLSQTQAKEMMV
ncbi:MAG: pyridoxal-dependent decarboxylase, exosortase A system-associated [Pseudomonadota bacterium]